MIIHSGVSNKNLCHSVCVGESLSQQQQFQGFLPAASLDMSHQGNQAFLDGRVQLVHCKRKNYGRELMDTQDITKRQICLCQIISIEADLAHYRPPYSRILITKCNETLRETTLRNAMHSMQCNAARRRVMIRTDLRVVRLYDEQVLLCQIHNRC